MLQFRTVGFVPGILGHRLAITTGELPTSGVVHIMAQGIAGLVMDASVVQCIMLESGIYVRLDTDQD